MEEAGRIALTAVVVMVVLYMTGGENGKKAFLPPSLS